VANEPGKNERDTATLITMGGAAVVWILLSVVVVGAVLLIDDDSPEAAYAQTVDVELGDFFIAPSELAVAPDTELTLRVVNAGDIQHDITTEGEKGTERLATGDEAEVNLGIVTVGQVLWCSVPGHREQGMEATIVAGPPPDTGDQEPE
jgi:uncharacterized cupredoxin-like copper-binding protein